MFIKFVIYPEDKKDSMSEVVIECSKYDQFYVGNNDGKSSTFAMCNDSDDLRTFEIVCERTRVYIMSNTGETVDSYRWTKTEDGAIKRM